MKFLVTRGNKGFSLAKERLRKCVDISFHDYPRVCCILLHMSEQMNDPFSVLCDSPAQTAEASELFWTEMQNASLK